MRGNTGKAKARVVVAALLVIGGLAYIAVKPKPDQAPKPAAVLFRIEPDKLQLARRDGVLQIWCLDVDQASATLIVTPSKKHAILVDAGGEGAGRGVIVPLFGALKDVGGESPQQIDLMVITHYDSDHIGGADEVLTELKVDELYDHGDHAHWLDVKGTAAMKNYNKAKKAKPIPLDFDRTIDGVRVRCLASNNRTRFDPPDSPGAADPEDDNPNSVALLISYEGFDFYIAGDQTDSTEKRLVGHVPDVDVYHMNHHGSSTHGSSHPAFLDALKPEVAIASNGQDENYRHPHKEPVSHLLAMNCDVFLMNFDKYSEVKLNAKFVSDDDPKDKDGTMLVVVDPGAGKYYVLLSGMPPAETTHAIQR